MTFRHEEGSYLSRLVCVSVILRYLSPFVVLEMIPSWNSCSCLSAEAKIPSLKLSSPYQDSHRNWIL